MPTLPPSSIILFSSTSSPTPSPQPDPSSDFFGDIVEAGIVIAFGSIIFLIVFAIVRVLFHNIKLFFKALTNSNARVVVVVRAFFRKIKQFFKGLRKSNARARYERQVLQDRRRALLQSQGLAILERYYKARDAEKLEQTLDGVDVCAGVGGSSSESSTTAPTKSPSASPTPHLSSDHDISAPLQHQRAMSTSSSRTTSPATFITAPCPAHTKETRVQMVELDDYPGFAGVVHSKEILTQREEEEAVYRIAFPGSVHPKETLVRGEEVYQAGSSIDPKLKEEEPFIRGELSFRRRKTYIPSHSLAPTSTKPVIRNFHRFEGAP